MKNTHLAALLGGALVIVAAIFMFIPVHSHGVNCGSAVSKSDAANMADIEQSYETALEGGGVTDPSTVQDACDSARSSHQTLALALGVPGLVLLIGGAGAWVYEADRASRAAYAASLTPPEG